MRWLCVLLFCVSPVQADDASGWREHITFSLTERVRGEFVDWFAPPPSAAARGAERYAFFASQLRAGVRVLYSPLEVAIEMQDTRFAGLPSDATLGPPHGALGPGATYFLYTHDTSQGEPFLKQGNVTLRLAGVTATLGRFEYRDGLETLPADGTLLALKRSRIAERLVGSFDFTHVSRSMDGGRIAYDRPDWNLTAFAARPTEGGFEVSANRQLDDIGLIGLALGLKRLPFAFPFDGRLFYLYYDDQRRGALKVDNRPLPVRQTDRSRLAIHTIGAHALTVLDFGPGRLDLLTWAAAQTGQWGAQDHNAWAYAIEAGYAWPRVPWTPWVRLGFDGSSGDTNPNDRHHDTFFQVPINLLSTVAPTVG